MVIRDDHLHPQRLGPLQCRCCTDAVIHGGQQAHTLLMEPLHHGRIEAIALLHAAGNGGFRHAAQPLHHPHQQGCAGHAIGVVIPTDGNGLTLADGPLEPFYGLGKVREMLLRGGGGGRLQNLNNGWIAVAPPAQHSHQRLGKIQLLGQL